MRILSCRLTRLGVLVLLVLVAVVLFAVPAFGATGAPVTQQRLGDIFLAAAKNPAVWITVLTFLAIPLLNAALTGVATHPAFKTALSAVLAGVYALVAWLTNLGDVVVDWKAALGVFFVALAGAGGLRNTVLKGNVEDALRTKVPVELGPTMTPEKAAAAHSNGQDLTVPVPPQLAPPAATDAPQA